MEGFMKHFLILLVAAVITLFSPNFVSAMELDSPDLPWSWELHTFDSQTMSDEAFLIGKGGQGVTLTGELRLPLGKGPFPAVILMHGSSGIGANIDPWVRKIVALGSATFVIDSVTGRSLKNLGEKQATLGRLNFIVDIYGALSVLAHHPKIDANHIAVMGFSRGGQAALYAAMERFDSLWNKSGVTPCGYVAFYANCLTEYLEDTKTTGAPIRMFLGGKDDYNPASSCVGYAKRLEAEGDDVKTVVYPNANHGFDLPAKEPFTIVLKNAQTARNCAVKETSPGMLTNLATKKPFSYSDSCVEKGPHVGADPEARNQAYEAAIRELKKMIGIEE
jgi:dienelactone hydrolase